MIDNNNTDSFDSKQVLQQLLEEENPKLESSASDSIDVKNEVNATKEKTHFRVTKRDFNKWLNGKQESLSPCQKFVMQHKNGINLLLKDGISTKQIAQYLIDAGELSFTPAVLSRNIEKICEQKI